MIISVPAIFIILNKNTTQLIGINGNVTRYEIPLYLKLYNFYGRNLNYAYMVDKITANANSDKEKVIHISKWINSNIKKLVPSIDFVDSHPLTIAERRVGKKGQFSDLLSVLLVYANIDSFFWVDKNNRDSVLTFFKIDGFWSIVDPYYGILFINNDKFSSIEELKNGNWKIYTLNLEEIGELNNTKALSNKFNNINEIKKYYKEQIDQIPTQAEINQTNIFDLGGRSYIQSPLRRLMFIIHNLL